MTRLLTARRVSATALAVGTAAAAQLLLAPSALAEDLPALSVSATTVEPGGSFTVSGTDCVDQNVSHYPVSFSMWIRGDDARYDKYTDADGSWSASVSTGHLVPGDYELHAQCNVAEGYRYYPSVTITIAEAAPAPAPTPPPAPTTRPAPTPPPAPTTHPAPAPRPAPDAPPPAHGPAATEHTPIPAPTATFAAVKGCTDCATIEGGGSLQPRHHLTLSYTGFQPGEQITVVLHSTPVTLGVFTADETGTVTTDVTIPHDAEAGEHTLTLSGPVTGDHEIPFRLAAAEVVRTTAAAPGAPGGDLPLPLVLGGIGALVVTGAGVTLYLRRRRATTPDAPAEDGETQEAATPIAAPMP